MNIRLQIHLGHLRLLEGADLDVRLPDSELTVLKEMPYLAGRLQFEHEEQPSITLQDDLESLVPELCIWSRPTLAEGNAVIVQLVTDPHKVTLTPAGESLTLDGSWGDTAIYPFEEAINALRECGHRFVKFLRINLGEDPEWKPRIRILQSKFDAMGEAEPVEEMPEPSLAEDLEYLRSIQDLEGEVQISQPE